MLRLIFKFCASLSKLGSKVEFLRKFLLKFPLTNKINYFIFNDLKPKRNTVIRIHGSKMSVDPSNGLGFSLWENPNWEKMETKIIQDYIKDGMVVVDIGANIGYYSLLAARRVGKTGKVYAFEPALENYTMLVKSIELNGYKNVIPVQKAVSNKNGVAKLFLGDQDPTMFRLLNSKDEKDTIEVSVVTLDSFFRDKGYKVDLIKMDIEGAELFALEGMQRILNENKELVIFSEFNPHLLKLLGVRPEDYLNKLVENGFRIYEIDEQNQAVNDADFSLITQEYNDDGTIRYPTILCKREAGR